MAPSSLRIVARFNGPSGSGQGGYTCGLVAEALGARAAEVTLRVPSPLDTDLRIARDGEGVSLWDGQVLVAEGRPFELELEPPAPVDSPRAEAASRSGSERWVRTHAFPYCFACGPRREAGDGLRLVPGPLDVDGAFACPWRPDRSLAGADGAVRPEFVWAALDCPTSAPIANFGEGPPVVLGRLAVSRDAPVQAEEPHVVVSWALERGGRRRTAAGALFDSAGRVLARSRAVWIELREGGSL